MDQFADPSPWPRDLPFLALCDIVDEFYGGRKRTKEEIQPGNEAPVDTPVKSALESLGPDLRERLCGDWPVP